MNEKKTIAVVFGGCSPEYNVSLESAAGVLTHLDRDRFTPVPVGITQQGDWFLFSGDLAQISRNTWRQGPCTPACISPNRSDHALLVFDPAGLRRIRLDAVLPILHGQNGEDGTVQGLCALAGIPVAGCGVLASALCMDKDRAHRLVAAAGIPAPRAVTLTQSYDRATVAAQAAELGYPLFVKPVRAGSSFGVAKVRRPSDLFAAVDHAFFYDDHVMLEAQIPGFEVGCAVLGRDAPLTGVPDEIELQGDLFDFQEKYHLTTSKIHIPARITPEQTAAVQETARRVYQILGCSGFARVDLFLTPEGRIIFHEVNTIPGFTPHSRFPSMMQAAGLSFREVLSCILDAALEEA